MRLKTKVKALSEAAVSEFNTGEAHWDAVYKVLSEAAVSELNTRGVHWDAGFGMSERLLPGLHYLVRDVFICEFIAIKQLL